MHMHPEHAHFLVGERRNSISRQVRQERFARRISAPDERRVGRLGAWLSVAGLRRLAGPGTGQAIRGSDVERGESRPGLRSSRPQEQCC